MFYFFYASLACSAVYFKYSLTKKYFLYFCQVHQALCGFDKKILALLFSVNKPLFVFETQECGCIYCLLCAVKIDAPVLWRVSHVFSHVNTDCDNAISVTQSLLQLVQGTSRCNIASTDFKVMQY